MHKKVMLIGETRVGKSSLIQTLSGGLYISKRAMGVEYYGNFINTPGEFLENHRFYTALITASVDADVVFMLQDATRSTSLFPPACSSVFTCQTVGIITKIDLSKANVPLAERFLRSAGLKEIVPISIHTKQGLDKLQDILS